MYAHVSAFLRDCVVLSENPGDWPTDLCKRTLQLMVERHTLLCILNRHSTLTTKSSHLRKDSTQIPKRQTTENIEINLSSTYSDRAASPDVPIMIALKTETLVSSPAYAVI